MNARRKFLPALALLLAGLFAGGVAAQSSSGSVTGKAAPGAVVVLHNEGTGLQREITVKKNGRYEARNLPTGTYSVIVKNADGSSSEPVLVAVRVGTATRVP